VSTAWRDSNQRPVLCRKVLRKAVIRVGISKPGERIRVIVAPGGALQKKEARLFSKVRIGVQT
jgi:hypothetical protein